MFTDDDLRRSYLAGTEAERFAILHELLRVEELSGYEARGLVVTIR